MSLGVLGGRDWRLDVIRSLLLVAGAAAADSSRLEGRQSLKCAAERVCANFVIDTACLAEAEVVFFSPGWKTPPVLLGSVATVINYGEIGRVDSCQFHAETSGDINYCTVSPLEYNDIFFWVTPVTIGPAFCKALYFYASLVSTRKCKAAVCLSVCLFCPFSYR